MHGVSIEFVLYLGYALFLALIALLLEVMAHHAHRRAATASTIGFTYHPARDVWQCPEDNHLFPVFSDPVKGSVTYRAPAHLCNNCPSKTACTDSDNGRTIERRSVESLQYGMQRFHRARVMNHPAWNDERQESVMMKSRTRLCPYYFVPQGTEETRLSGVLATVCPADKKILHGMRDAIMLPCIAQ